MSVTRVISKLSLRSCLSSGRMMYTRKVSTQNNFEGVFTPYFWDHETGFGFSQNGNLVIVNPNRSSDAVTDSSEAKQWQELLDPCLLLDHNLLKDELQMNVLAYDDDALHIEGADAHNVKVPIYHGNVLTLFDAANGSPFATGGNSNQPDNPSGDGALPSSTVSPYQACA